MNTIGLIVTFLAFAAVLGLPWISYKNRRSMKNETENKQVRKVNKQHVDQNELIDTYSEIPPGIDVMRVVGGSVKAGDKLIVTFEVARADDIGCNTTNVFYRAESPLSIEVKREEYTGYCAIDEITIPHAGYVIPQQSISEKLVRLNSARAKEGLPELSMSEFEELDIGLAMDYCYDIESIERIKQGENNV